MKWMQWVVLSVLVIGGATASAEYDAEGKKIFKTLMGNHAPAFVRVNWVMATSFMGQEQNTESSTTGVIVDPTGLVLVPRIVVEPTMPNQKLTPEQRASFKMTARDFQIHFPGEDKPLTAEALTTDADQGVAWLKIKDVGDRKFPFVDTTRAEAASPGQSYYVIERLEERYGEKPILSWGIIQGEIDVPQKAHIVTGALGLAFSAKGKVLGYVSANFEGMGNDSFSMTGGMRMLMTPAKRLHSANLRAASLLDEPVAP